jgi:hypothetical protein
MPKQTLKVFCLLSVLGLGALPALAQSRSSSADLTETVSAPSRLPLRGASVTATILATGPARGVAKEAHNGAGGAPFLNQFWLTDVRIVGVPKNTASQFCGSISAFAPRVIQLGAKFNF